jgi:hypothetical protein
MPDIFIGGFTNLHFVACNKLTQTQKYKRKYTKPKNRKDERKMKVKMYANNHQ